MNVAQWLNAIDLGQYEALFREHEIDAGVLPDLVEADLEKIGVPLGHRKRLMRAIAALSAGETPPSAAKPASAKPSPSAPTSGAEAERRPITVMFCDLVGSTGLAASLDVEDWRNLAQRLSRRGLDGGDAIRRPRAEDARRRADGAVRLPARAGERRRARRSGGARDPARACRTQRQERRPGARRSSSARIGIESGPVVVDATGEVFGDAPNVAARVQALAEPGAVLVTAERPAAGGWAVRRRGARRARTQGRVRRRSRFSGSCARAAAGAGAARAR